MPEILHVMPRRLVFSEDTTLRERSVRPSRHSAPGEGLSKRAEVEASAKTQLAPFPRARGDDWRASSTDFDDWN